MSGIITLTTDFGLSDAYAAAMKGIILGINPEAKLVDISHGIQPQNIYQAAFVLSTAYQFFPERTVHVVVVDPGVGTARRAVILRTALADFVAPDNGVLSCVLQDYGQQPSPADQPRQVKLPPDLEAVTITRPKFWRTPVSATFHGRDIFAPVAARLALGVPPTDFGERVSSLTVLPGLRPYREATGMVVGRILHIDSFGNLITNIKGGDLPGDERTITIEAGGNLIQGLSRNYAEGKGLLALIGSRGYLEIALRGGNAGARLGAGVGGEVKISTVSP